MKFVDIKGCSPAETVRRVGLMVEESQAQWLAEYESDLINTGADCETVAELVEAYRVQLATLKQNALETVHNLVEAAASTRH
jgi:hypothetical protein